MGLLDRFRSRFGKGKKITPPKHAISKKQREAEAKRAAFRAISAGPPARPGVKAEAAKRPKKSDTKEAYRTLLRPLTTEKSTRLTADHQYVFEVHPQVNRIEIRRAVRALYGVTPLKVNVVNLPGKAVRYGRTEGRTKAWKKAVVVLNPNEKIDVLESS